MQQNIAKRSFLIDYWCRLHFIYLFIYLYYQLVYEVHTNKQTK